MAGKATKVSKKEFALIRKKDKEFPLTKSQVEDIIKIHPTPWDIYDAEGIRGTMRTLNKEFAWAPGFKNYFAVKALPNHHIVRIVREEKGGADCSSMFEMRLSSEKAGVSGEDMFLTSNDTPYAEFKMARELGAIINLDDITHIPVMEKSAGIPPVICFRYNPGRLKKGNAIIGKPEKAKYGLTKPQLFEAYRIMKKKGVKRFGLHMMVASNELNPYYFVDNAKLLFDLVGEISSEVGIRFEFINMGGGIGTPYRPEQKPVDLHIVSKGVKEAYRDKIMGAGLHPLKIFMENGRCITGPHGWLVTTVLHIKHIYKDYIGVDACLADHPRTGLYGAYHHITPLGKEKLARTHKYDVTGSLCENNDRFAFDFMFPDIAVCDRLVIHNTGAHSRAMGSNYNGKPRCGELLLKPGWKIKKIRRQETYDDYTATLVD
jgi:diaminopimelate decarboxylase